MPELDVQMMVERQSKSSPQAVGSPVVWQRPQWLLEDDAELARLATLTMAEREAEWDALSPEEKATFDAAFDQLMKNIEERQRRDRGLA